jgi:L-aspartate oxidase
MHELRVDHLWLDLRPVGRERLERQFPTILQRCRSLGLRPCESPIPVAPAAHYWMGGITTDLNAATSLPGLYAVGEVACTGVHGANRLASNSLMECLVFARRLRRIAIGAPQHLTGRAEPLRDAAALAETGADTAGAIRELRQLCWSAAGVERSGSHLAEALGRIRRERAELESRPALRLVFGHPPGERLRLRQGDRPLLLATMELWNRLVLAELLIEAARFRQESRGGHFRLDAPAPQPFWQCHSVQQRHRPIRTVSVGNDSPGGRAATVGQKSRGPS